MNTMTKNIDLELATLPQISQELEDRGLGYVLLVETKYGRYFNHTNGVKAANVMLALNNIISSYLCYASQELETEDQNNENE